LRLTMKKGKGEKRGGKSEKESRIPSILQRRKKKSFDFTPHRGEKKKRSFSEKRGKKVGRSSRGRGGEESIRKERSSITAPLQKGGKEKGRSYLASDQEEKDGVAEKKHTSYLKRKKGKGRLIPGGRREGGTKKGILLTSDRGNNPIISPREKKKERKIDANATQLFFPRGEEGGGEGGGKRALLHRRREKEKKRKLKKGMSGGKRKSTKKKKEMLQRKEKKDFMRGREDVPPFPSGGKGGKKKRRNVLARKRRRSDLERERFSLIDCAGEKKKKSREGPRKKEGRDPSQEGKETVGREKRTKGMPFRGEENAVRRRGEKESRGRKLSRGESSFPSQEEKGEETTPGKEETFSTPQKEKKKERGRRGRKG